MDITSPLLNVLVYLCAVRMVLLVKDLYVYHFVFNVLEHLYHYSDFAVKLS